MKKAALFPVQTKWKVEEISRRFGIPQERIPYWPNGVDAENFEVTSSKKEARKMLGFPPEALLALYAGQLFPWKGVDTFVESIASVKSPVHYLIVGGEDADRERLHARTPVSFKERVHFFPFQSREKVPLWLRAADVLVLPNTGKMKVSTRYTSPMKLFEYMAAGKPIVASDIPSVREIVSEQEVFFARPDDPASFAAAIDAALSQKEEAEARAQRARELVSEYTWRKRAALILEALRASRA